MNYLALIYGGQGPDVWDLWKDISACDFEDATKQAMALAQDLHGEVGAVSVNHARSITQSEIQEKAMRVFNAIESLRKNEGAAVTIPCDPPEFGNRMWISVCDDWTGWDERRFEAENIIDALEAAVKAKSDFDNEHKP